MNRLLKTDLHIHTCFSPDSLTSPEALIARCIETGLTCIAVTEHNTIQGALAVAQIAPFQVIIGEEIRSQDGDILGLFLKDEIPPGLSALETIERIRQQDGLVAIPHPLDRVRPSAFGTRALETILPHIDCIEIFNARNLFNADNRKAERIATSHGLPGIAASDAHGTAGLGNTYTMIPEFDGTAQGLKNSLKHAQLITKSVSLRERFSPTYSRLRKAFRHC